MCHIRLQCGLVRNFRLQGGVVAWLLCVELTRVVVLVELLHRVVELLALIGDCMALFLGRLLRRPCQIIFHRTDATSDTGQLFAGSAQDRVLGGGLLVPCFRTLTVLLVVGDLRCRLGFDIKLASSANPSGSSREVVCTCTRLSQVLSLYLLLVLDVYGYEVV